MKKTKSLKRLKLEADRVFSLWIRKRDRYRCYTCGKQLQPNESQCGHYISRNHLYLRYDEQNCHCQCMQCNVFKKGNMAIYAINLADEYGVYLLKEFEQKKLKSIGDTRIFLNGIIKQYGI